MASLFAVLLVGSVTLATYFFVADGMVTSAHDTSWGLAQAASESLSRAVTNAKLGAAATGLEGYEREREANREFLRAVPDLLKSGIGAEGHYALYVAETGEPLGLTWYDDNAALTQFDESRELSLERGQPIQSGPGEHHLLNGLLTRANLGTYVIHVPLDIPNEASGVLDVVYSPDREEAILDAMRLPMLIVAAFAFVVAVLMMQSIMGWVLSLVKELKTAADSVSAAQLDVTLPEQAEHEIADLTHSLNELIERLRMRAEAQTRFVADASHELATPVAGIRGYVNILREWGAEDQETREEAIDAIDRESRRMAKLCGDLLSMIRSEEVIEYKRVRYDLNAAAREILAAAATRYIDKDIEFVGPQQDSLWVTGDPDRIEEAMGIIVDNSGKYTPQGGTVRVTTKRHRDKVVIEISDTGVGIPAEDIPNIFERFYRSDASRSKETGGFGLGLAIAKHIVDQSAGTISVRSKVGSGTTFLIELPRTRTGE